MSLESAPDTVGVSQPRFDIPDIYSRRLGGRLRDGASSLLPRS